MTNAERVIHDRLMAYGASKLSLLGLNDVYAMRMSQIIDFEKATLKEANERIARLEAALRKIAGMQIVEQFEILEGIDLNDPRR